MFPRERSGSPAVSSTIRKGGSSGGARARQRRRRPRAPARPRSQDRARVRARAREQGTKRAQGQPKAPGEPRMRRRKPGERHDAVGREEDVARVRPRLPRAGRRGGRVPRHRADADQALRLRQRRDLRPLPGFRPRLRRVRAAEPHLAHQRVDHGAADHGRRPQTGLARRITVVTPFFGYARQDKKNRGREPISARLMADLFATAGADRLMAVDLHTAQIQGFFDGPVDHLFALSILATYIEKKLDVSQVTVVAPDAGRVRVCERWTDRLGCPLAIIHKRRDPDVANQVRMFEVVGQVAGRTCILVDDMIDTGATIVNAAETLFEQGAAQVIVTATHGVLSGPAVDLLKNSRVSEVIVTNTLPITNEKRFDKLTVLSIAPLLARAITEVFSDGSVTSLFDGQS